MTKQAWFCPACQRHHAPHCDTCPSESLQGGADLQKPGFFDPQPFKYWQAGAGTFDPCAACRGKACGNAACPKMPKVTCTSNNLPGSNNLHLGWFTPGLFGEMLL